MTSATGGFHWAASAAAVESVEGPGRAGLADCWDLLLALNLVLLALTVCLDLPLERELTPLTVCARRAACAECQHHHRHRSAALSHRRTGRD